MRHVRHTILIWFLLFSIADSYSQITPCNNHGHDWVLKILPKEICIPSNLYAVDIKFKDFNSDGIKDCIIENWHIKKEPKDSVVVRFYKGTVSNGFAFFKEYKNLYPPDTIKKGLHYSFSEHNVQLNYEKNKIEIIGSQTGRYDQKHAYFIFDSLSNNFFLEKIDIIWHTAIRSNFSFSTFRPEKALAIDNFDPNRFIYEDFDGLPLKNTEYIENYPEPEFLNSIETESNEEKIDSFIFNNIDLHKLDIIDDSIKFHLNNVQFFDLDGTKAKDIINKSWFRLFKSYKLDSWKLVFVGYLTENKLNVLLFICDKIGLLHNIYVLNFPDKIYLTDKELIILYRQSLSKYEIIDSKLIKK